jgi:hypothetical protein
MDRAIEKALKEKQDLEERLAKINQFLALYEEFSGTDSETPETGSLSRTGNIVYGDVSADAAVDIERVRGVNQQYLSGSYSMATSSAASRKRTPGEIVRMATAALKDVGKPMTRGELAEALKRRGAILPGNEPERQARYVGTILWRNQEQFENIEGKGYWLRGRPIPLTPTDVLQLKLEDEAERLP